MKFVHITGMFIFLLVSGCSKGSSPAGPTPPPEKDYLALGWQNFEGKQYDSAATNFTAAYNKATTPAVQGEALSGRGWTYAYKRDLPRSKGDFTLAISITGINPGVLTDVCAGIAFVLYSLNDFPGAASTANAALADNPAYVFSHDSKVTAKRLRLLLVQSYFANGQFVQAAAQLDVFDPAGAPHSADPTNLLRSITGALNSL
jgi:tetratricopeptide (TPR) repeat protein